ncbi:MAG: peptidase M23 [Acidobacteria bacterium]|nr:MAG: peptidase M23 [Acidobacteriota bacterium]
MIKITEKRVLIVSLLALFSLLVASSEAAAQSFKAQGQQSTSTDWNAVAQALGKAGSVQPGDVYKVSLPRSDLQVTVGGVQVKPALALGSWVAFKKSGNMTMVMGDLVLAEDEVTPVLTKLQEGGIQQTALHNHVLHENPRVMYMHISSTGDAVKIAKAIHDALSLSKTPFTTAPTAGPQNQDLGIDTKQLDQIMKQSGKVNGGVYQFSVPRSEAITDNGMEVPPAMGVATAINFQPTGGGKAAITGDFVLIASEVNPVIKALRDNGIEMTALHSHMLTETPRLFFMHFWANDDAQKLARGLRAALDKMNIKK